MFVQCMSEYMVRAEPGAAGKSLWPKLRKQLGEREVRGIRVARSPIMADQGECFSLSLERMLLEGLEVGRDMI